MPTPLTRTRLVRGLAALVACLHLAVGIVGPLVHAPRAGRAPLTAPALGVHAGPADSHDARTCLLCQASSARAVPTVGPRVAFPPGNDDPAFAPTPDGVRERPVYWRILQRPPPSLRG